MPNALVEAEETLIIETPERVPLAFSLASIGNRFLAVTIDHAIQFFVIFLIYLIFTGLAGGGSDPFVASAGEQMPKWTIALMILALFLVFASYFIFFEWFWNGQTPGKRLLKLRVIRDDGRPITIWEAVARNLLRIFDAIPGFVIPIYSIGLIVIFMSGRDQRVGDIFAGTVVIRERSDEAPAFEDVFSNRISDAAFRRVQPKMNITANVSDLTEDEMEVVEVFLRRRWDLSERQRSWMAWRVALPLMYKLKPGYERETFTYEGFLEEIIHRFHLRRRHLN
jgi:uncharacterized RDD family membrane protein YckC